MESLNLVKVDLKIKYNTIFNSKDNTKKILIFLFVLILAIIPIEFSIIKNYYILKNINMESIILIAILNIESLLIFITTFIGVSNNFFLEHNVSTLLFYPIKSRSILFSKSILEYLKGFAIGLIGFVFFITYGILNNCSIYYYLKVLILQLIIPIICVISIFNFLLFISIFLTNTKKYSFSKILFYIIQITSIAYSIFYFIKNKVNFFNIINFILELFEDKISINYIVICLFFSNVILFLFYLSNIYMDVIISEFKFRSRKNIVQKNKLINLKFKSNNILFSLIKKDLKEIIRTPILLINAIIPNILFFIIVILITPIISTASKSVELFLTFIIIILTITMTSLNTVANFSFSRETSNLKYLKFLPLKIEELFISKIITALILNVMHLISLNILIISVDKNISHIIMLNIVIMLNMLSLILINIITDFNLTRKSFLNLSEIFNDVELVLKPIIKTIPITLIYTLTFIILSRVTISYTYNIIIIFLVSSLESILSIKSSYNKIKILSNADYNT